jgi:hypothetical protein
MLMTFERKNHLARTILSTASTSSTVKPNTLIATYILIHVGSTHSWCDSGSHRIGVSKNKLSPYSKQYNYGSESIASPATKRSKPSLKLHYEFINNRLPKSVQARLIRRQRNTTRRTADL